MVSGHPKTVCSMIPHGSLSFQLQTYPSLMTVTRAMAQGRKSMTTRWSSRLWVLPLISTRVQTLSCHLYLLPRAIKCLTQLMLLSVTPGALAKVRIRS
uniref:Uncharacterized protein n=1 Tax=Arundo donax TaxID=35708 RepID=A0A0A9HQL2_ARUDO